MSTTPVKRSTEFDKQIGKKILKLRLAMGLSRDDVAKDVGVTHQQFTKYESGMNRISVGRFLKIAKALKTDPSYFYSDDSVNEYHDDAEEQPRIRMNIELARSLQAIDSQEIQNAILQLIKKISNYLKTSKKDKNEN